MLAERWQRLRAAYDALRDAPESERARMLAEFSGSDPDLGRELSALVAADANPDDALDRPFARLLAAGLAPGIVLCDRFLLLRCIGQGGMGEVWAARDQRLKEDIAIKTIRLVGSDPQSLKRFTREIQLARRISHPNVCRVYELFEDASATPARSFLTMELLEGETLAARLTRLGPMPPAEAIEVFRQVVSGVGAAHDAEVIHRDLKPANIMLVSGSSGRRAVVMDFGLARDPVRTEPDGMTVPGTLVGTPEYMAPEQVSGTAAGAATDIYALGLILFEMLRGAPPFAGSSTLDSWMRRAREGPARLSGAVPGVQARIDTVIARCLEYQASRRYQTASQMLRALDSSFHIVVPRTRRFWIPAAVVALAAVILGGATAWERLSPDLPSPEVLKWYEDAQEALSESASVRALNAINRAIELAPGFAPSHAALAEIRLELDMPSAAQEAMLRANELGRDRGRLPEEYVGYMDGIQALLQRQCDTAIDALRRVADTVAAPQRPSRMVTAARAMERCDRPDEAQSLMAAAARIDPRNAAAPLRSARLAARRRDYAGAMASLDTAEKLFRDRNNAEGIGEVLTMRGTFQAEQDNLREADVTLAKAGDVAVSLDDVRQQIRVLLQKAIVHRKRGAVAAAGSLTTDAIDLGRRSNLETLTLEGLFAAGNVHLIRNQFDEAGSLYERALGIAEVYRHEEFKARAHLSQASRLVQTLRPGAAGAEIKAARPYYESVKHTRNLALLDALGGQVRLALMDYTGAIVQFEAAAGEASRLGYREQEVGARENLATALAGAGRYPDALAEYQRVRQMHESAGRVRGATFAALNAIDLLSRLGRFPEAMAITVPPIEVAARELRAQQARVEAAVRLRNGDRAGAVDRARMSMRLGAGLSPERLLRAEMVLCLATAGQSGGSGDGTACADLDEHVRDIEHPAIRLESLLIMAEARLTHVGGADVDVWLRQADALLANVGDNEHRWRYLALARSVAPPGATQDELAERLTREVQRLRLEWAEKDFESWRRRSDVARLVSHAYGGKS